MTPDRQQPKPEFILPRRIEPMIPRQVNHPIRNEDWIAEIKLNGFRAIAYVTQNQPPELLTSVGRNVYPAFPELEPGLNRLGRRHSAVLDGEVVSGYGKTSEDMRTAVSRTSGTAFTAQFNADHSPCQFVVFDLLHLDGQDLTHLPLSERKKILAKIVTSTRAKDKIVRIPFTKAVRDLHRVAKEDGYEGVIYKDRKSPYLPGQRTSNWLKYKFPRNYIEL